MSTRIWHWINAASVIILFMSGLNISNAHRRLYWGDWGFSPDQAWLVVPRFPGWATIPNYYSLSGARDWHIIFSLVLGFGLLTFLIAALINGHMFRNLFARAREWRLSSITEDIRQHLRLNFEHGDGKYNILQKIAYASVLFVMLPSMIFTGMVMSPGMEAAWPWMTDLFGGRQSARSIHFIMAWGLFGFFIVHIALVVLAGPVRQIRDMITGGKTP
ncbi:MAG: cytochrome b/b6 domain-containing protein [Alteraurantiacibacter sp. bin_em_oilr2.035]|uniref:cytochrome b/b6 domain-containing protein n=1 Tax=Aurantiacibacter atlanticus TaxID=1648404 RepID=UPI0009EE69DA|nr:cytochrome b/b6 domain-containing protein [Aurantiacibacter atlanticus]MDF1834003.1 cytochrome b/b6 domain-containing protein [Alteraurantiacibacter sp. bin_em_oilr2.035]